MPKNEAAWLVNRNNPLEVRESPYSPPSENEIVVKNHAVAVNPVDWIIQAAPGMVCPWMKFPYVLGSDCSGEVVEVGTGVTRFKVGDRIVGHALGVDKKRNRVTEGAFQHYTHLLEHMSSPIPATLPFEDAAVLPLGLSTAACGLFQKDHLALQYPTRDALPTGKTLLVWGGSTSVGSNAIQLAVAAGYEVVATASPANFAYIHSLGATHVLDYNSPDVVQNLIKAFSGKSCAGALAIGATSAGPCMDVVHAVEGKRFVSMATFPVDFTRMAEGASIPVEMVRQSTKLLSFVASLLLKSRLRGIRTKAIYGTTLVDNEVSTIVYRDFLPNALADGRYVAAPRPEIVGNSLECLEAALKRQRKGVSARKLVVTLES